MGRSFFSQNQLHKKSCNNILDMLIEQHNINWNHIETWKKRGTAIYKIDNIIIDENIPIFHKNKDFIDRFVKV